MNQAGRRLMGGWRWLAAAAVLMGAAMGLTSQKLEVTVFAAASATNAVTDVGALFGSSGKREAKFSFASSSTLAKQIEQGAPADLYISADQKWMDYLDGKSLLVKGSRFNLLGNSLVLIAPADSKQGPVEIKRGFDLRGLLGDGRLAMGDPDHVPAGIYGKEALLSLGVWSAVESRVARADNVRAALLLVERGETPLGIVYGTDAALSGRVKVVGTFPEQSHSPIEYPVAIVAGHDGPAARAFVETLKSPEAAGVFKQYGFIVLP